MLCVSRSALTAKSVDGQVPSISGTEQYGLANPNVVALLEELPNVNRLTKYSGRAPPPTMSADPPIEQKPTASGYASCCACERERFQ